MEQEDVNDEDTKNESTNDEEPEEKLNVEDKVATNLNEIKINSNIYPQLVTELKEPEEIKLIPSIKAYTEQQLSSLYINEELQLLEQFTNQFVEAELRGTNLKQHLLHELLASYLSARSKIVGITLEIEQLRKEYNERCNLLWNLESSVVSDRGQCQDGVAVFAAHTYTKATFQRNFYQTIAQILTSIRTLTNESYMLHTYSAEVLKLKVNNLKLLVI